MTQQNAEPQTAILGAEHSSTAEMATRAARIAAVLFVVATATTMASQMILEQLTPEAYAPTSAQRHLVALAVLLEIANGLASAGIALAFYPVLRRASELAATGYIGLRIIEGTLGVVAAAFFVALLITPSDNVGQIVTIHDATFLCVLIVFSVGTLFFYPVLYRHRFVPRFLSLWGLIGGVMLLVSCLLLLFGQIAFGGGVDLILSLPIWVNEMVLAAWLLLRGLDPSQLHAWGRDAA